MRCCNLLNGQTESYLMLPVKVTHRKQPYHIRSAQGSVYTQSVFRKEHVKASGGVCLKKRQIWSGPTLLNSKLTKQHSKSHDFLVSEVNSILCCFLVLMPFVCTKSSACIQTAPQACSPFSQVVHLQMPFTKSSACTCKPLQRWYDWCFLIRLFSVGKGCSCKFLNEVKFFSM